MSLSQEQISQNWSLTLGWHFSSELRKEIEFYLSAKSYENRIEKSGFSAPRNVRKIYSPHIELVVLVEELECLATWRDGPCHYIVGKLSRPELGPPAHQSDEDRYRCFVYEDVSNTTTQVAISPYTVGIGIPSPLLTEGSKVMKLTRADLSHTRCKFPPWVTQHRHWYSLDKARQYNFSHTNTSFRHEVREDPSLSSLMPSMALLGHGAGAPPSYSTGALAAGLQGDRHKRTELLGVCHSLLEAAPGAGAGT
ncbi:N5-carboxyaminoimidazole ribonucleotide synthase [Frankliniella fusca]|uniref:N5-carboxyaminoimidazole ribonucleotide synthase n=1 Tax=Frankliniella fusca TaxID=407009 RepID=A0AAE1GQL8_9NEOP|nr:N5-carboxyaminoimidazole ribonucleotide synthase [Frankliniella fusca]